MIVAQAARHPLTESSARVSIFGCLRAKKHWVEGEPDVAHVSASYVERQNLTMRMSMRRFTRLTNAFSKKLGNHIHALALYFAFCNFCRVHKSLPVSPAIAAGVSDRLWSMEDIVALIDAKAGAPKQRGPYKRPQREGI